MSWEGFSQNICPNGHYFEINETCRYDEKNICPCGLEAEWSNLVDETNGLNPDDIFDIEKLIVKPAVIETCNMGHKHIVEECLYRLPTKEEIKTFKLQKERSSKL